MERRAQFGKDCVRKLRRCLVGNNRSAIASKRLDKVRSIDIGIKVLELHCDALLMLDVSHATSCRDPWSHRATNR